MVYVCTDQRAGMDTKSRKGTECQNRILVSMIGSRKRQSAGKNFGKLVDRSMIGISFLAERILFTMGI